MLEKRFLVWILPSLEKLLLEKRVRVTSLMVSVLFVCKANICRSPIAHGLFREFVRSEGLAPLIHVDSAGTHACNVGRPPDRRSRETASRHGIDLSDLRSRRAIPKDIERFDYVLAMDQDNYHSLMAICPLGLEDKPALLMDYAPHLKTREIPDPFYGPPVGFDKVFDLMAAATAGLLDNIRHWHLDMQIIRFSET